MLEKKINKKEEVFLNEVKLLNFLLFLQILLYNLSLY